MSRTRLILAGSTGICVLLGASSTAWSQANRRFALRGADARNELPAKITEGVQNEVIQPIPLTSQRLQTSLEGVHRQIRDQVTEFKSKVKQVFPDEIDALSGTGKWRPEDRNALLKAIQSVDPAAVYEAWLEANPADTAGAEQVARQTAVKRTFLALEQSAEDGKASTEEVNDLADALDKLAPSNPQAAQITQSLDPLRTWVEIQKMLDSANPDAAGIDELPTGRVTLIHNPNLSVGTAVVLANDTVMVGSRGRGGVEISKGNAAEALGLPVISDDALPNAEGAPKTNGVLLMNPTRSGANVRYMLNGETYIMKPGMSQKLQPGSWVINFDRGGSAGASEYRLEEGTYQFTPTESGWELYKHRYDITIDNSRNPRDFHFVFNKEPLVVREGRTKTLTSRFPIVLRYDRGNGGELATKMLNFSGTVEVGINAADNLWDLFPEEGNKKRTLDVDIF
ncbi:MAG TPA: hypothetical protein VHC19_27885 [Pirellulales bacterium]|nr:hypothetical protein [Pirellulales bacterium]